MQVLLFSLKILTLYVVYISYSFWLLAVWSQALIHKMTTIFTQNENPGHFDSKKLSFCEFAQVSQQLLSSQIQQPSEVN